MRLQRPAYLFNHIQFARSERTRNIIYPRPRTQYMSDSFFVRCGQIWNELPNWVKMASSIDEFKLLLRSHLNIDDI